MALMVSTRSRLQTGLDGLGGAHRPREERARGPRVCISSDVFCRHSGFDSTVRSHKTKQRKHVLFTSLSVWSGGSGLCPPSSDGGS